MRDSSASDAQGRRRLTVTSKDECVLMERPHKSLMCTAEETRVDPCMYVCMLIGRGGVGTAASDSD